MLKGISSIISPDLIKILMEMGHGDEIVLADGNFPAASVAQRLSRSDGNQLPQLLEAVLRLFPLDTFVEHPAAVMAVVPGDSSKPTIWEKYRLSNTKIFRNSNMSSGLSFISVPEELMQW